MLLSISVRVDRIPGFSTSNFSIVLPRGLPQPTRILNGCGASNFRCIVAVHILCSIFVRYILIIIYIYTIIVYYIYSACSYILYYVVPVLYVYIHLGGSTSNFSMVFPCRPPRPTQIPTEKFDVPQPLHIKLFDIYVLSTDCLAYLYTIYYQVFCSSYFLAAAPRRQGLPPKSLMCHGRGTSNFSMCTCYTHTSYHICTLYTMIRMYLLYIVLYHMYCMYHIHCVLHVMN